jgi:ribosomal peptide maturation radical SAM protein 1
VLEIQLVSMPFAGLSLPSLALTQIRSVLEKRFRESIRIEIHYLNLEVGAMLGAQLYDFIAFDGTAQHSGLGEWLFSRAAFAEHPDLTDQYFRQYGQFLEKKEPFLVAKQHLLQWKEQLPSLLDHWIDQYGLDKADMVGFTSMFQQTTPSVAMARQLRLRRSGQVIIMGGANCEGLMGVELAAHLSVVDFIFSGASLVSLPLFVQRIMEGDVEGLHSIDGVLSRRNVVSVSEITERNECLETGQNTSKQHLKGIELIGRELDINTVAELDYDDYLVAQKRLLPGLARISLPFETSRGCWWGERAHCTFCGLNGETMAYRSMTPKTALKLIRELIERYTPAGIRHFQCVDNILPRDYAQKVFENLTPPKDVRIFYEVKADLTEEQLIALARGGVRTIQPGIEALATSTLKLMRKGTTAFQNVRLLMHCLQHAVIPIWNLLVGFPGEKLEVYEDYMNTLPTLFHLFPPSGASSVRFDRYSPYFAEAKHYQLELAPFDYYALCFPFPHTAIRNMAYYFTDQNETAPYQVEMRTRLPQLAELTSQWRRRFLGEGDTEPARLELLGTTQDPYIEDTREGSLNSYPLSSQELELLVDLEKPKTEREILASPHAAVLANLREKRLIFSERERFMSVVMNTHFISRGPVSSADERLVAANEHPDVECGASTRRFATLTAARTRHVDLAPMSVP